MSDLRDNGEGVMRRVELGEQIIVTRDGRPVATLCPLPKRSVGAAELIRRRRRLPKVDVAETLRDVDDLMEPSP